MRLSALIQTGAGTHPASYIMGRSFAGVKRPGCGVDHPPPSSAEVKKKVELYLYSPFVPSWPVLGSTLPLSLLYHLRYILHSFVFIKDTKYFDHIM